MQNCEHLAYCFRIVFWWWDRSNFERTSKLPLDLLAAFYLAAEAREFVWRIWNAVAWRGDVPL